MRKQPQIFQPFRFMPKKTIETKALKLLQAMGQTSHYLPKWPLDASRVAEFLGLDVVWDSIPDDQDGQIAARILPLDYLIEINEDIPKLFTGFGESTIAHEIGHWVLHINPRGVSKSLELKRLGYQISVQPMLCRNHNQAKGIEWQAQYFATCLLMPEYKLAELSEGRNLSQWRHLYIISQELGVTISNLVHRLKDLGWINIASESHCILKKSSPTISE